jgi:hypothetical protein
MNNSSKTYHCTPDGVYAHYTDSRKHFFIPYEKTPSNQSQIYGNKYKGYSYKDFEDHRYSYQQYRMYQKCLYGLKVCSPAEIKKMSFAEKVAINFNHKRTQQLINLSKWKADCDLVDIVYGKFFKKVKNNIAWFLGITNELSLSDNEDINYNSLQSIGGKDNLIRKLVEERILPSNFYNLNN